MEKERKKLSPKAKKAIIAIAVIAGVLAIVIASCNIWAAVEGGKEQTGVSVRADGATLTGGGLVLPQSFHGDKLEKGMTDLSDCGTLLLHIGIADKAE